MFTRISFRIDKQAPTGTAERGLIYHYGFVADINGSSRSVDSSFSLPRNKLYRTELCMNFMDLHEKVVAQRVYIIVRIHFSIGKPDMILQDVHKLSWH